MKYFDEYVNENKKDMWEELNSAISNGVDVYGIAKRLKLLSPGQTKDMWRMRGGVILDTIAQKIENDKSLQKEFGIE